MAEEIRTTSSTGAEKGVKPERYDLIPVEALAAVARLYGVGAKKYADHNWRKGYEFSKSYSALQRHANAFWRGENVDEEMGESHLAAVVFHAFTLWTLQQEHPEFDDRYISVTNDERSKKFFKAIRDIEEMMPMEKPTAVKIIPPSSVTAKPGEWGQFGNGPVKGDKPKAKKDDLMDVSIRNVEKSIVQIARETKAAIQAAGILEGCDVKDNGHGVGSFEKKEDLPLPICAKCGRSIGNLGHKMECREPSIEGMTSELKESKPLRIPYWISSRNLAATMAGIVLEINQRIDNLQDSDSKVLVDLIAVDMKVRLTVWKLALDQAFGDKVDVNVIDCEEDLTDKKCAYCGENILDGKHDLSDRRFGHPR